MSLGMSEVGHVGIHVSDMDRSVAFYRKVVGLKVTGLWGTAAKGRQCFMRIDTMHHNLVLNELPAEVDRSGLDGSDTAKRRAGGLHHIAFGFPDREAWLNAIDHVRSCGIDLVHGPLVHAPEGLPEGGFIGGSGSHAFYFLDPDGNRIEFYCWMMKVRGPSIAAPEPDL